MKFRAILFDLDDTLLVNSMDVFVPAYFQALTRYMAHLIPPQQLVAELLRATHAMERNTGDGPTNEEAFAAVFYPALGRAPEELRPHFERFYAEEFPKLHGFTRPLPEARKLVEWAFRCGLQVAITTNPLFPRVAIEQRLAWAGVPAGKSAAADAFPYALITSYEMMHATKSHPAYYREVLSHLGRRADECLMVGDSWEWDIAQAAVVGIPTYWIAGPDVVQPASDVAPIGRGTLGDLWEWVQGEGAGLFEHRVEPTG